MENNNENKAKFFAQYWGVKALYVGGRGLFEIGKGGWNLRHPEFFLELKPLSSITDEDAIEVAKFEYNQDKYCTVDIGKTAAYLLHHYRNGEYSTQNWLSVDFLRSKGYALPYMGLSVETLVDYGWVKLSNQITNN